MQLFSYFLIYLFISSPANNKGEFLSMLGSLLWRRQRNFFVIYFYVEKKNEKMREEMKGRRIRSEEERFIKRKDKKGSRNQVSRHENP